MVEIHNEGRVTNLWLLFSLLLNNNGNVSLPVHDTLLQLLYYLLIGTQFIYIQI